jgi:cell division septation protein DedD
VRGKLWYRVRVGPEIDRKRIESMAASLVAQTGLKVQIQRYP